MSFASMLFCRNATASDKKRDAGLTTPSDIQRYDDILYGRDPRWQSLDVYRPKGAQGQSLPVIVSVHGGGWVYGDKELYQYYCMSLAQQGFAVVNFTYRLAPKYKFPSALEDTNLVFHWIMKHQKEYGFDVQHLYGVGDSAGANLLGIYVDFCINPDYAKQFSFQPPQGIQFRAVALNCGVYDVELCKKSGDATMALMRDLFGKKGMEEKLTQISVKKNMTKAFPPTFLMTANQDFLKEQAPVLAECMRELGIVHEYHLYGDDEQPLGHVFHCDMRSEIAKQCNTEECEFFKRQT